MSRRLNRSHNEEKNISIYVLISIIGIVLVAFVISYVLYTNKLEKQGRMAMQGSQETDTTTDVTMMNMVGNSENSQAVSTQIGKSVNELETSKNVENSVEVNKTAVNTSNEEKKVEEKKSENIVTNTEKNTDNNEEKEPLVDPSFVKPVDGEIIKDYAKDNLVFSTTLEEWTTHNGIDFASEKTDIVKASADGKIKSIKNDPRYGLTVVIEHSNGFESVYSSLLTAEFVSVGENVKQSQTIGTVGNTATFEIADETHLHFEIWKDGVSVDPNIYLK